MKKILTMAAASLLMVGSAFAAEGQLYIGLGAGILEGDIAGNDASTNYGEFILGVEATENVSVEGSYQYFQKFDVGPVDDVRVRATNFGVLFKKGFDGSLSVFARLFAQLATVKANSVDAKENSTDLGVGLGFAYAMGEEKKNTLRLEYRNVDPMGDGDEHYAQLSIVRSLGD